MKKYLDFGFYKKWVVLLFKTIVFIPKKLDLFRILLSAFTKNDYYININTKGEKILFPSGFFLDSFVTFTEIFIDKDYDTSFIKNGDNDGVIIDFGSNFGYSVKYFNQIFPKRTIYAVEADQENFQILNRNLKEEINRNAVVPINKAISNNNKGLVMEDTSSTNKPVLRFVKPQSVVQNISKKKIIESISPDDLLVGYNINKVILLKIDIEGGENILFSDTNCLDTILNVTENIIIETHDMFIPGTRALVLKILKTYNYKVIYEKKHEFAESTVIRASK